MFIQQGGGGNSGATQGGDAGRALAAAKPAALQQQRRPAKEAFLDAYMSNPNPNPNAPRGQFPQYPSMQHSRKGAPPSNPGTPYQPAGYSVAGGCCAHCGASTSGAPAQQAAVVPVTASSVQSVLAAKKANLRPAALLSQGSMVQRAPLAIRDGAAGNYRSEVLGLEHELQQRLQTIEDAYGVSGATASDRKMEVFSDMFEAVIGKSKLYGGLLAVIKQEYDAARGRVRGAGHTSPLNALVNVAGHGGYNTATPRADAASVRSARGPPAHLAEGPLSMLATDPTHVRTSAEWKEGREGARALGATPVRLFGAGPAGAEAGAGGGHQQMTRDDTARDDETQRREQQRQKELQLERASRDKEKEAHVRERALLKAQVAKLQEELDLKTKKMDDIERAVKKERDAMRAERSAMQQDYTDLQTCLAEREQDIQQLGQIITAVQKGDIKLDQLQQLDLSGDAYTDNENGGASKHAPEPRSQFADVPTDEITWEISLSSRQSKPRPAMVPLLNLSSVHPEISQEDLHKNASSYANSTSASAKPGAIDPVIRPGYSIGNEDDDEFPPPLEKETSMPSLHN